MRNTHRPPKRIDLRSNCYMPYVRCLRYFQPGSSYKLRQRWIFCRWHKPNMLRLPKRIDLPDSWYRHHLRMKIDPQDN